MAQIPPSDWHRVDTMDDRDPIASLVYDAYRTINDPEYWSLVLRHLECILNAEACDLSIYDFHARSGAIAVHSGCYDDKLLYLYESRFATLNPWMQEADYYCGDDACWFGRQIVPEVELASSEFYDGWLRPQNLFHRLSASIIREDHVVIYVSLLRGKRSGPFQNEVRERLQRLVPHLRQALGLYRLSIGSTVRHAVPLWDVASRFAQFPVFRLHKPIVHSANPEASWPSSQQELECCPIISQAGVDRRHISTAEPAAGTDSNESRLFQFYRLTAAEARLAQLLAGGLSLSKAASALDISMSTVRTHLQRIFNKTFTHHQAQLVALLLLGPAKVKVNYHPPEDDLRELD
jgi:DNA-binding CsgD family transcriptional regulator